MTEELYFPNITCLIKDVKELYTSSGLFNSLTDCLNKYIRQKKYWPMIQTKQFKGENKNIVLLHNSYKRDDVEHFKELYDEVRSVVLDLSSLEGTNIVVSLADKTPNRITDVEYEKISDENDVCELSYEGTMIYVYNHNDKWFFGTTTCPSMDNSMYFHPTKTHGRMFDEYLEKIFKNSSNEEDDIMMDDDNISINNSKLRDMFCKKLNKSYTYAFMLVHHQNKHVMDYTSIFGNEYIELFHIFTREKVTTKLIEYKLDLPIKYTEKTTNKKEALEALRTNDMIYSLIVTNLNSSVSHKVSLSKIIEHENENIGNSNVWMNLLHVYLSKNNKFKINDYINKYLNQEEQKEVFNMYVDSVGMKLSPTFIIDTTMKFIAELLNFTYQSTTHYDNVTKKYKIEIEKDRMLYSNIRYHMAQLRDFHKKFYSRNSVLENKHIMRYLCNLRLKDIRLLIQHIQKEEIYYQYMNYNVNVSINILNMKLKGDKNKIVDNDTTTVVV